ncbi:osmoprotectant transport system substrate-binding protein [Terrisporobacter glycolicus]|nr:osmoprotectant transport system substrate-binding protein [Terrisporobacter glycolicus]
MKKKVLSIFLCMAMMITVLTGCESKSKGDSKSNADSEKTVEIKNEGNPIVIASMTDEEGQIYGELMKQVLEANGYKVDANGLGTYNNTTLPRQSLMEGQVDMVVDYTGRGMMFIKDVDKSLYQKDLKTAFETTKKADEKNGLEWLCYSPYNNTDGICVKKEWAEKNKIKTFEDLADYLNKGGDFKLAIATENSYVADSPTCLPGWEEKYGFKLKDDQVVVGVTEPQAMVSKGSDNFTAASCYTTGGAIDALDLYVIKDTKTVSPVYSPSAICTKEILKKYPELKEVLEPAFSAINEDIIREMNKKLSTDGENVVDIVSEFLKNNNLIK